MSLLDLVKKASLGAVDAANPVSVLYGTVVSAEPLEIRVDQRFTLTKEFLVVAESLTEYRTTVGEYTIVVRRGLYAGDEVILLREQGGQQYVVLDRVVP